MNIARGSASGKELERRAGVINGLEDQVADMKGQLKELQQQIKDELANAKSEGFNPRAVKQVCKELRMDPEDRDAVQQYEMELDTYRHAVGLLDGTERGEDIERKLEQKTFREAVAAVDELTGGDNVAFMDKIDRKLSSERRERNRANAAVE